MKPIHLFFILILITFQSCTSSSNNQLSTLVNDVITEKEDFITKSIPINNSAILVDANHLLWHKVEIINNRKSIFVNREDYDYYHELRKFAYNFSVDYNKMATST